MNTMRQLTNCQHNKNARLMTFSSIKRKDGCIYTGCIDELQHPLHGFQWNPNLTQYNFRTDFNDFRWIRSFKNVILLQSSSSHKSQGYPTWILTLLQRIRMYFQSRIHIWKYGVQWRIKGGNHCDSLSKYHWKEHLLSTYWLSRIMYFRVVFRSLWS